MTIHSNTKEKIETEALNLFSTYGYSGTSMNDIAKKVGISKAALYKHFNSKEEIFDVVIAKGEEYYRKYFYSVESDLLIPNSLIELKKLTMNQLEFTIKDTQIIKYRKLITIGQFSNKQLSKLANRHFEDNIITFYEFIFKKMMNKKLIKKYNPKDLALLYVSPITIMVNHCDRNKESIDETLIKIKKHIDSFNKEFGVKNENINS